MIKKATTFDFQNTYADNLNGLYKECIADPVPYPKMLLFNYDLAEELELDPFIFSSDYGLSIFSGNEIPEGSNPIAQAYAGHQFGNFNPHLGDGRALLLGEIVDIHKQLKDIQLKGSGITPFSRRGDGKSALGPVLREYLISESMHAMGIPTTRSLAAIDSGENVLRESSLPGGILTRIASSHIRIGTFEYASKLEDKNQIKKLADYSIARHYPDTVKVENSYLAFFAGICNEQASLIANWMSVGFIHGVMNTDNMTISGETIDYGPCAFMDEYNPATVFSSIDKQGRYAYANQPAILTWNLTRLAETLIPLINQDRKIAIASLTEVLQLIKPVYENYWLINMRSKIGLLKDDPKDYELINNLLQIMDEQNADFTLTFRFLSKTLIGNNKDVRSLFVNSDKFDAWLMLWQERVAQEEIPDEDIAKRMNEVNPIYIPRNHKVEEALDSAVNKNDIEPLSLLLSILVKPYEEIEGFELFTQPAPLSEVPYKTFCGT
jgi:uncharacterized protein YdiU (UPF0061 family)